MTIHLQHVFEISKYCLTVSLKNVQKTWNTTKEIFYSLCYATKSICLPPQEVVDVLFGVGELVPSLLVCNRQPINLKHNHLFLVDINTLKSKNDIKWDDSVRGLITAAQVSVC